MPVIVRELSDDAAVIFMVDSNLQRENILPSERAAAYKMKLDAMKRQGMRTDLTSTQLVPKLKSSEALGQENKESRETVRRYIRLTELQPELMKIQHLTYVRNTHRSFAQSIKECKLPSHLPKTHLSETSNESSWIC